MCVGFRANFANKWTQSAVNHFVFGEIHFLSECFVTGGTFEGFRFWKKTVVDVKIMTIFATDKRPSYTYWHESIDVCLRSISA